MPDRATSRRSFLSRLGFGTAAVAATAATSIPTPQTEEKVANSESSPEQELPPCYVCAGPSIMKKYKATQIICCKDENCVEHMDDETFLRFCLVGQQTFQSESAGTIRYDKKKARL